MNCPADPAEVGNFIVQVPAASWTEKVTVPLVVPASLSCPVATLEAPRVGVAVKAGPAPPRTCPATPVMLMLPVAVVIARGAEAVTAGVPLDVPAVQVGVEAVACGEIVRAPLVDPSRINDPSVVLAKPSVRAPAEILAFTFPLTTFPLPAYHVNWPDDPTTTVPEPLIVLQPKAWVEVLYVSACCAAEQEPRAVAIGAAEPPVELTSALSAAILASDIVPVTVTGPPVNPVPVATLVTVPVPVMELQPNPVFVVQISADDAALQDGIACAEATAEPEVPLPRTVFAPIDGKSPVTIALNVGAPLEPFGDAQIRF